MALVLNFKDKLFIVMHLMQVDVCYICFEYHIFGLHLRLAVGMHIERTLST